MSAPAALKLVVNRPLPPPALAVRHIAADALTPSTWQALHHELLKARNRRNDPTIPPPPRPPALSSWWTGGEAHRKDQWLAFAEWAYRFGFDEQLSARLDHLARADVA